MNQWRNLIVCLSLVVMLLPLAVLADGTIAVAESADLDSVLSALLGEAAQSVSELTTTHAALKDKIEALVPEDELWQDGDVTLKILWTHPLLYQLSTSHANCNESRYKTCTKATYIKDEDDAQELFSVRSTCEISTEILSCVQDGETKITLSVGYIDEEAWDGDLGIYYTKEYTVFHCFEKENGKWQEISLLPTLLAEAAQSESISIDMQPTMAHALDVLLTEDQMWGWMGKRSVVIHYAQPTMYLLSAPSSESCQEPLFMLDEDGLHYLMGIGSDCGPLSNEVLSCVQDGTTKITITICHIYYDAWDPDLDTYGEEETIYTICFGKENGAWQEIETNTLRTVFYPSYGASSVPATLIDRMSTRTGPGAAYTEDLKALPKDTEIVVFQQEMGSGVPWGLVEFELDDMYYRAYIGMKSMDADSEPPWAEKPQTAQVIESITPYYGPGSYYTPFKHTLQAGTWVEVFGCDGTFALVDYPSPDKPEKRVRSWIPLRILEGYQPPHIVRYPIDGEEL
ncbi:MAG: hypothetical protein FWD25_02640 [Clostridia bacterium]|nr:hypothetical protein [Clostridia bacterium]